MKVRRIVNSVLPYLIPKYQIINATNKSIIQRPYSLYMYNNWHNGDLIFSRPLYKKIIESGLFNLVLGVYKNRAYLLEDFVEPGVTLHVSPMQDHGKGCSGDLSYMRPSDYTAIHTWLGQYPDTHPHTWRSTVTVFNRKALEHGIDFKITYDSSLIPMVEFPSKEISLLPNAVYIENGETRSEHSYFYFDLKSMSLQFPHLNFYCTSKPNINLPNIHDYSNENLITLSSLSEQCIIILGKGSAPLLCTYTEKNRFKPRAVCGYDTTRCSPFWDYPQNPLQYLQTMENVMNFILEKTQ